jgi:hypothetical protein
MASNVKEQSTENVEGSIYYSIQLDESTDVSNIIHPLAFISFGDEESVKEELLFCKPLLDRATSNGILNS